MSRLPMLTALQTLFSSSISNHISFTYQCPLFVRYCVSCKHIAQCANMPRALGIASSACSACNRARSDPHSHCGLPRPKEHFRVFFIAHSRTAGLNWRISFRRRGLDISTATSMARREAPSTAKGTGERVLVSKLTGILRTE